MPPAHKGGSKGDRGGGGGAGPSGGAGGAGGAGLTGYGIGKAAGGSHLTAPGEKGGSANAKGSEYSSHNR